MQPLDDLHALAHDLDRGIADLTRVLRAEAPYRRSVTALLTLRRLDVEGPSRIGDLASAERVAQPTMTVLVKRLEEEGLVERAPDPDDARAVRVSLTAAGRAELNGVRAGRAEVLSRRLAVLDAADRDALAGAVAALQALIAADPETR